MKAAQPPASGHAPVNGLRMYYEIHGQGDPVVLLHGSYMAIAGAWLSMITELAKTRQVIAVEMQGHGRTADIDRPFGYDALAGDVAALLEHLDLASADLVGYSMGAGVAIAAAIRHPQRIRKVVSISGVARHDGWTDESLVAYREMTPDALKGSPYEADYKRLSATPDAFPAFVMRVIAMDLEPYDFGIDRLAATAAPFLFIHGDADGVRLAHIAEMFRAKGGEVHGDLRPRSTSRLAILPDTTHVTLMQRLDVIVPMIEDFLR